MVCVILVKRFLVCRIKKFTHFRVLAVNQRMRKKTRIILFTAWWSVFKFPLPLGKGFSKVVAEHGRVVCDKSPSVDTQPLLPFCILA